MDDVRAVMDAVKIERAPSLEYQKVARSLRFSLRPIPSALSRSPSTAPLLVSSTGYLTMKALTR